MTTWHNDETIEEVLFFGKFNSVTGYHGQTLKELLVLDLGRENREAQIRQIYEALDSGTPP
jgi:hypothetical protein